MEKLYQKKIEAAKDLQELVDVVYEIADLKPLSQESILMEKSLASPIKEAKTLEEAMNLIEKNSRSLPSWNRG